MTSLVSRVKELEKRVAKLENDTKYVTKRIGPSYDNRSPYDLSASADIIRKARKWVK